MGTVLTRVPIRWITAIFSWLIVAILVAPPVAHADGLYGNYWVYGKIEQEYLNQGGPGRLGNPVRPESAAARGGRWQEFQNSASIYWHPLVAGGNAKMVGGQIRDKWGRQGWENGTLMYPTSSEFAAGGGTGRGNHFEGGSIYWTASRGAFIVWGAIRDQWAAQGWENGPLGFPVTDEYMENGGYVQHFQNGTLTWNVGTQADIDPQDSDIMAAGDDPLNKFAGRLDLTLESGERCGAAVDGKQLCFRTGRDAWDDEPDPTTIHSPQQAPAEDPAPASPSEDQEPTSLPPAPSTSIESDPSEPANTDSPDITASTPPSAPSTEMLTPTPVTPSTDVEETFSEENDNRSRPAPQARPFPRQPYEPQQEPTDPDALPSIEGTELQIQEREWLQMREGGIRARDANPQPYLKPWCAVMANEVWRSERYYSCVRGLFSVTLRSNGVAVGGAHGEIEMSLDTQYKGTDNTFQIRLRTVEKWGSGINTTISLATEATCTGACQPTLTRPGGPTDVLTPGQTLRYSVSMNAGSIPSGTVQAAHNGTFWAQPSAPGYASIDAQAWTTPQVRCDAQALKTSAGCVMLKGIPTLDVTTTRINAPELVSHVARAQNSGLPGHPSSGRALNRILENDPRKGPNRATACPSWLPRPDSTKTCDEYPMASTAQGASTGLNPSNGRTFAGCLITAFPEESGSPGGVHFVGFSSCMIKANQNSAQGGIMVTFYRKNRVLDGDALYVTAG